MNEGIVLENYTSSKGINVDATNIEIIVKIPAQKTQKEV